MTQDRIDFSVTVFAYNEERGIAETLGSAIANVPQGARVVIRVLANGCTDRTAEIVRRLSADNPAVHLHELALGDKCNAWNTYVYALLDDCPVHFFMDGDVTVSADAFAYMVRALSESPTVTAVAGMPQAGRGRDTYSRYIRERGWVFGNLYGVRHSHLQNLIRTGIRLPLGLRGNDHFITRILQSDLHAPWLERRERITFDGRAGYVFPSLNPLKPADVGLYYRRRVTYRLRELQLAHIADAPLSSLPADMSAINQRILHSLTASPSRHHSLLDRAVIRRLKRRSS